MYIVTDDHGELVTFDKQGDGVSRYNIMNFRRHEDTGKYGYFSVGRWANGGLRYILRIHPTRVFVPLLLRHIVHFTTCERYRFSVGGFSYYVRPSWR